MISLLVICNFVMLYIFETNASSMSFVKTKGNVIQLDEGHRIPAKGKILDCARTCNRISGCNCMRVSADDSALCQAFNPKVDVNLLNDTGFIYYSWDKYNETINGPNIALTKPSLQSSDFLNNGIKYTADRAIDGKRNIVPFEAPYISQTSDSPPDLNPWWQVDLKAEYVITGVTILNRKGLADRLHDLEIRVGNVQMTNTFKDQVFQKNPLCSQQIGSGIPDGGTKTFICAPCPILGRYVSIQIVRNCKECSEPKINILNLAEVDVHGFLASSVA